jgi:predicted nucleic acid-binding protein
MAGGDRMGAQEELILIDTNVFVIDLRYKRDVNYHSNLAFLDTAAQRSTGFTTLINLLELCGILSFNLSEKQLFGLWAYFQQRYKVTVLPPADMASGFPGFPIGDLFEQFKKKICLGDALMLAVAKNYLSFISTLVTWDKDHFTNKFPGTVITPNEYVSA